MNVSNARHNDERERVFVSTFICRARIMSWSLPFSSMIQAPRLLCHIIPLMIICRPGTAAAAGPLILTAAAASGILQGAQLIQHLTVLPYLIKRRLAHIPQLHIEISTRLHLAPWANYTISRSCQTTSAEAGFQAHLGSNPQKLRCTGRLQLNLHLLLLLHNPRQSVLISLRPERFRLNSLCPACRHQKEEDPHRASVRTART